MIKCKCGAILNPDGLGIKEGVCMDCVVRDGSAIGGYGSKAEGEKVVEVKAPKVSFEIVRTEDVILVEFFLNDKSAFGLTKEHMQDIMTQIEVAELTEENKDDTPTDPGA